MWKRPYCVGGRVQTARGHHAHAGEAVLAVVLQAVAIGVVEDLAGARRCSRTSGSGTMRTVAVASPDIALPVTRAHGLRAVHELAFADAGADGEQQHQRVLACPASTARSLQLSSRPATVGSVGTPSSSAEPST